jgi:hypothetical protein
MSNPPLDQSVVQSVGDGGGARGDVEFGEDVSGVGAGSGVADEEGGGDFLVGLTDGDEAEYLQFSRREGTGSEGR